MPCFRVEMKYQRAKTFFVQAETKEELEEFIENDTDWDPSDVDGLVESDDSDCHEFSIVEEEKILPVFEFVNDDFRMIE